MTQLKLTLPKPGTYIIAVSGGVDSVVLLDLLASHPEYQLIVATLDHGWREDSGLDTALVEKLSDGYGLPFVVARLLLPDTTEVSARTYRYAFLRQLARDYGANGILLAHHADDVRETALLNAKRGADRHGLAPMREGELLIRPLRNISKQEIISYAQDKKLAWNEDISNADVRYRRNALRLEAIPAMSEHDVAQLDESIDHISEINPQIDRLISAEINALGLDWSSDSIFISTEWLRNYALPVRRHVLATLAKKLVPHAQLRREQIERLAIGVGGRSKHSHFRLSVALSATLQRDKLVFTRDQSVPVQ